MAGRIEGIWVKRMARGVMDSVDEVAAVEGQGLEGDASFGRPDRQLTIIEREVFERLAETLPDARPEMRRANVLVSGVRLAESAGRVLALGEARILLRGETRPCRLMDELCPGLRDALDADWGGGAHGVVVAGGRIRVGDAVALDPVPAAETA